MRSMTKILAASALTALVSAITAMPASAACTRLSFTVNDYGKDGPTKDAKALLDTYIVKNMAERGVTKYNVGPKTVKCELFLDVILFDEHTCRAEASVCWDGAASPKSTTAAAGGNGAAPAAQPASKPAVKPVEAAKAADTPKAVAPVKPAEPAVAAEKKAAQ